MYILPIFFKFPQLRTILSPYIYIFKGETNIKNM